MAALAALLALAACAVPEPRPGPVARIPYTPEAFRAELRGGTPGCPLRGNAVHLGNGLFLTAAHLVDGTVPRLRQCPPGEAAPVTLLFGGRTAAARVTRLGEGHILPGIGPLYRRGEDLALLRVDTALPGAAAVPCGAGPHPGQTVMISSSARGGAMAAAGELVRESRAADGAYVDLPIALLQGESGAGVFDADSFCLLGIVSHRPDAQPDHSRIVAGPTIQAFLAGATGS